MFSGRTFTVSDTTILQIGNFLSNTSEQGMKIVCAPDSFKESISAAEAAKAMAAGVADANRRAVVEQCPVGDGGEGTLDALRSALNGRLVDVEVTGPLGEPLNASFFIAENGRTGIVELAQLSGLALVPCDQRDPTKTTTFGTGQLIAAAIDDGCTEIIVCIGGSATCDGGTGIVQALGVKFFDHDNQLIEKPLTGGSLTTIARFERANKLPAIRVACDVTNPLLGENGAAAIYGPQKGATPDQVAQLDSALAHLASLPGVDNKIAELPGAGASGGAGFGLAAFCDAKLEPGIDLVLDILQFDERCRHANLVLTGEGRLDAQSLNNKATIGVARAALKHSIPAIAIVGATGKGAIECLINGGENGALRNYRSLSMRFGKERAMNDTANCLREITAEIVREFVAANQ